MADTDMEKDGYSRFARFMMLTVPVVMVVILLVVLAAFIDTDFRNRLYQVGQAIPVINKIVPEPRITGSSMNDEQIRTIKLNEKIAELEQQVSSLEAELQTAVEEKEEQESMVAELEVALEKTQSEETNATDDATPSNEVTNEQYNAKVTELASMFSKMMPSKAAPIIQNMTNEEATLLFSAMRSDDRVRIMEKMNPKQAADLTVLLKDEKPAKDLQLAALQSQINKLKKEQPTVAASTIEKDQLAATFNSMDAKSAADLLLKMNELSTGKVLKTLEAMNDKARSAVLAEMATSNQAKTAQIVAKLIPGK
ncbi:MotE family protein [Paenibacillus yanchengensis]|uniref:MotE family protein n=1 Tax=Paenibacillus yanchengensis TaxID=2035833 RepID=A0ABW4YMD6_9BACL